MIIKSSKERRANHQLSLQIEELLKCKEDPVYFINKYFKFTNPQTFIEEQITLRGYQEQFVKGMHEHHFVVGLKPRQAGLGLATLGYLLWRVIFCTNENILIVRNNQADNEQISRLLQAYHLLPVWMKPSLLQYSRDVIRFSTGMKVLTSTYNAVARRSGVRGLTINLAYLPDLANAPKDIQEEAWQELIPSITCARGKIIIESTPNGKNDLFNKIWDGAINGSGLFVPYGVSVNELPYADDVWKQQMKSSLGHFHYRQEIECEFIE